METKRSREGALPMQDIESLYRGGFISNICEENIKPASIDLRLDIGEIHEVRGAFQVPRKQSVWSVIKEISKRKLPIGDPVMKNRYYVAKVLEKFDLPRSTYGYANPKSTTGRDDTHAKLLADFVPQNDCLVRGFNGDLWTFIKPQSFSVLYPEEVSVNQSRLFYSDTRLNKHELEFEMQKGILFSQEGNIIRYKDMDISDTDSITLTLDASHGYKAIKTNRVLEYDKKYAWTDFFEEISIDKNKFLKIEKDAFYILSSLEKVRVPEYLSCEMRPMEERFGELRAHYAGFIDPGWGIIGGRTLTLEVRSFEDLFIKHGQPIAKIRFERMAQVPTLCYDDFNSNYINQNRARLAKQFIM